MVIQSVKVTLCTCSALLPRQYSQAHLNPLKCLSKRTDLLLPARRPEAVASCNENFMRRHVVSLPDPGPGGLPLCICRGFTSIRTSATGGGGGSVSESNDSVKKLLQGFMWIVEGVYIVWLFLLPYAPGDPVWAISPETVSSLIGLSLNFLFILPLSNSVGIHLMEAPVLHPMSEGLFNFVIGWTLMFAPLLYTDKRRGRFKGSLDVLWGLQMFLTNAFLIPYMAIRLNEAANEDYSLKESSKLGSVMTNGAPVVGVIGGFACLLSIVWALYSREAGSYGGVLERVEFLLSYLGSERLAYAFIWDICLYTVFQPWLIGDNLDNIQKDKVPIVNLLRFVPVAGIVAYCLFLDTDSEK